MNAIIPRAKSYRVGDGATQIIDGDTPNDTRAQSIYYGEPVKFGISAALQTVLDELSAKVAEIISEAGLPTDYKAEAYERSRADVARKRREMRRGKGRKH